MTASPYVVSTYPHAGCEQISIALISPNEEHRAAAAQILGECKGADVREFDEYPDHMYELPRLIDDKPDVVIIDIDSDFEIALELVQSICATGDLTVMVCSAQTEPELLVRCMQAGAREFLNVPFRTGDLEGALARASVRLPKAATRAVRAGRLLVFMGAKGGVGVTSIACNFAVALAQEPSQKTLLIDLDLPLGDAALNLGITSEYSTVNALQSADRLDGAFLSKLLVKHKSGLRVLAAPGRYPHYEPSLESIERLLGVARREFDNVVIDVGSRFDLAGTPLHRDANAIYLVTQAGIPELRNSNRMINQIFTQERPRLEIVLNRYQSRTIGLSEKQINEALTRPVEWKIPNDHALMRRMQIDATPLVMTENPVANMIRAMAKSAFGSKVEPTPVKKKKGIGQFFGN